MPNSRRAPVTSPVPPAPEQPEPYLISSGDGLGRPSARKATRMKAALLLLLLVTAESPASAHANSNQAAWGESSAINCESIRSYVSQVGLAQARALARARGMTASQEWRARQCLAKGD
jgi:hypothetical protein